MTGQPQPSIQKMRTTLLRSELLHRVRLWSLKPNKLISLSLCAARSHRTMHGTNLTKMWCIRSKFQIWYDGCYTCSRSILILSSRAQPSLLGGKVEPRCRACRDLAQSLRTTSRRNPAHWTTRYPCTIQPWTPDPFLSITI